MKKAHFITYISIFSFFVLSNFTIDLKNSGSCPIGRTGAPSFSGGVINRCTGCHGDFSANPSGGSVTVTGLPELGYTPGQSYPFSLTITHATTDRKIWGFSIKAISTVDRSVVGTWTTTNTNASIKSTGNNIELSHFFAPTTPSSNTYTFSGLTWTAPSSPTTAQQSIKFYYTALAGNNSGNEIGDYVYYATSADLGTLPIKLDHLNAVQKQKSIHLSWTSEIEINVAHYNIERSIDGVQFTKIGEVIPRNSSTVNRYEYIDPNPIIGKNFYRIQIIETNGSFKYTKIIDKAFQKNTKELIITPNPVRNFIHLNDFENNNFSVLNLNGQKLLSGKVKYGQINISTLNPGSYLLFVIDENGYTNNIKFIKQ